MITKFTFLADNQAGDRGLRAEHGLSIFVETKPIHVLFDTGASDLFYENSRHLDIELFGTDAIVLSHGHYDHSGGIAKALQEAPKASLMMHPEATSGKRYARKNGILHYIGIDEPTEKAIASARLVGKLEWVDEPMRLGSGVMLFPSRGKTDFSGNNSYFRDDPNGVEIPDPFTDEISLLIEGDASSCLVVGCAHSGLQLIIETARELTEKPIVAIIGGSHLDRVSDEEINEIAQYLKNQQAVLYLGHCTGVMGFTRLSWILGNQLHPVHAGLQFQLEL